MGKYGIRKIDKCHISPENDNGRVSLTAVEDITEAKRP